MTNHTDKSNRQIHPFAPVISDNSEILILGSFPSVKSRENRFYYGHPRNRFWQVLAAVYKESVPNTIEDKTNIILNHKLALWDTLACCDIHASADSSIKNEQPNDILGLVNQYGIMTIIFNGNTSYKFFKKYFNNIAELNDVEKHVLPSTSPANAAASLDKLIHIWSGALIKTQNPNPPAL